MKKATFGAGCFWHVEDAFRQVPGVVATRVGYSAGWTEDPTYTDVCSDGTGHAEVVEVTFDPDRLSYGDLLDLFWSIHDPTTPNRQGPDIGTQYRSAIYYHDDEQQAAALASKETLQRSGLTRPIVTEITEAMPFYEAEDYHQQYYAKRGINSCRIS